MDENAETRKQRIAVLHLDEPKRLRLSPQIEHERRAAIFDLLEENHFAPRDDISGPYVVYLAVDGDYMHFDVRDGDERALSRFDLPLSAFRSIIKDYFLICDSYFKSIRSASPSRIEAIDMGRRGLHNEGAELLRARLAAHVDIDTDTARRLFTLLCVLHIRG